ncbi:MAG: phospholipase D-like domain-containing protein, partial [Proteobacteria bacterium]|nr:phospholipase D-like domain-containing protein [Pseudomonadota bacterium]
MLSEINLKQSYHKPEDDIASEFYLPCLKMSTEYDRAVGYFSSAVYVLAWKSLQQFIDANGRIRLICSPYLTGDDSDALYDGYTARADSDHTNALVSEFRKMLASPSAEKPARVLAALIAIGVVDIKVAWMTSTAGGKSKRLFHDKLGIFRDARSNVVAFKGSMNETWSGLSIDGNLESVDVFVNWREEGEKERVEAEKAYFDKLWSDEFPGVQVRPISDIARNEFVANADPEGWPGLLEEICLETDASMKWAPANTEDPRVPRAH